MRLRDLDAVATSRRNVRWPLLALACGVLLLLAGGAQFRSSQRALQASEASYLEAQRQARTVMRKPNPTELQASQSRRMVEEQIIRRTQAEWNTLFAALESSFQSVEGAATLLSLQIGPQDAVRQVLVAGAAESPAATMKVVAALRQHVAFSSVRLLAQQHAEGATGGVRFQLTFSWTPLSATIGEAK